MSRPAEPLRVIGMEGFVIPNCTPMWNAAIVVDRYDRYVECGDVPYVPVSAPFSMPETGTAFVMPIPTSIMMARDHACLVLNEDDVGILARHERGVVDRLSMVMADGIPHAVLYRTDEERRRLVGYVRLTVVARLVQAVRDRQWAQTRELAFRLERAALCPMDMAFAWVALEHAGFAEDAAAGRDSLGFLSDMAEVDAWKAKAEEAFLTRVLTGRKVGG